MNIYRDFTLYLGNGGDYFAAAFKVTWLKLRLSGSHIAHCPVGAKNKNKRIRPEI